MGAHAPASDSLQPRPALICRHTFHVLPVLDTCNLLHCVHPAVSAAIESRSRGTCSTAPSPNKETLSATGLSSKLAPSCLCWFASSSGAKSLGNLRARRRCSYLHCRHPHWRHPHSSLSSQRAYSREQSAITCTCSVMPLHLLLAMLDAFVVRFGQLNSRINDEFRRCNNCNYCAVATSHHACHWMGRTPCLAGNLRGLPMDFAGSSTFVL